MKRDDERARNRDDRIARSLGELYQRQAAPSPALQDLVAGYTRENLTKRLVEELDNLCKPGVQSNRR